jgi:hypothetical protein
MKDRNGKDRIDYRPQAYWKTGTKVTLRMNLAGVDAGGAAYGTQEQVVDFTIGKAVTSTVDVVKKTLTVARDGTAVKTLPVSTGKIGFARRNRTASGLLGRTICRNRRPSSSESRRARTGSATRHHPPHDQCRYEPANVRGHRTSSDGC